MLSSNVYSLINLAKNGDEKAKEILVEKNLGLVYSVVKKFYGRGYDADDLFQIGCIGLVKAIEKFDTSFNVQFSTYAIPMIIGEIKRFIRDDGMIKVSRSLKELAYKASTVRERLAKINNCEPTVSEIAEEVGVSCEELMMALDAGAPLQSIYAENHDGTMNILSTFESPDDSVDNVVTNRIAISEALMSFKARERQVIFLRYFAQKTQVQIAKMLGISQVQVSRIEKKVLEKMQQKFSDIK